MKLDGLEKHTQSQAHQYLHWFPYSHKGYDFMTQSTRKIAHFVSWQLFYWQESQAKGQLLAPVGSKREHKQCLLAARGGPWRACMQVVWKQAGVIGHDARGSQSKRPLYVSLLIANKEVHLKEKEERMREGLGGVSSVNTRTFWSKPYIQAQGISFPQWSQPGRQQRVEREN